MTKIDKPANEPEVAMARWDESHVDIDNDTFVGRGGHRHWRHMGLVCGVSGCSHEAANAPGFPPRCNHHSATPEEIAAMRDRIAELEQVAIDQAEKIAAMRDRIAELEQVAIDQAEKIASVWGSE